MMNGDLFYSCKLVTSDHSLALTVSLAIAKKSKLAAESSAIAITPNPEVTTIMYEYIRRRKSTK